MALASKVSSSRAVAMRSVLAPSARCARVAPFRTTCVVVRAERLRLGNLSPADGSRRPEKRKGRGVAAGQGGTCGFGNNGQKSRAGSGTRPGFEGGQTALYRRLPKLRGIAGGMGAGLPDHVVVNLDDLSKAFEANQEVTIQAIKEKVKKISGREARLPLKVLGTGELTKPLVIKAAAFSATAKSKIEAAGGKMEVVAGPKKWKRKAYEALKKELEAKGLDYAKEHGKKRFEALKAKGMVKVRPVKAAKATKPFAKKAGKV